MSTKAGRIAILAGLVAATLGAAPAAGTTTVRLSRTETVGDEAKGAYEMLGTPVGDRSGRDWIRRQHPRRRALPERHRKTSASPPTAACSVACLEHAIGT